MGQASVSTNDVRRAEDTVKGSLSVIGDVAKNLAIISQEGAEWRDEHYGRLLDISCDCMQSLREADDRLLALMPALARMRHFVELYDQGVIETRQAGVRPLACSSFSPEAARPTVAANAFSRVGEWLPGINPHFSGCQPLHAATVNCGACAYAVDRALSGNMSVSAGLVNLDLDFDMEQATGRTCVYMSPDDVVRHLIQAGPGSHFVAGINRTHGNGHWFNLYYDGQAVYTIDGQVGAVYRGLHDYGLVSAWCLLV